MSEKVDTGAEVPDVQFPRSGGQKAVLWLDVSQTVTAAVLAGIFLLIVVLASTFGWSLFMLGLLILDVGAILVTVIPFRGRPLPWWIKQRFRALRHQGQGQDSFVSHAPSARELEADAQEEEAAIAAGIEPPVRLRLPGEAAELRLYQLLNGSAMVWDPVTKTAAMVARVVPHGFRMAEPEDQNDVLANWASLIDALHSEPGVLAVQASDTITTASAAEIRQAYERQVEHSEEAGTPAGASLSPLLHNDYLNLLSGDRSQVQHDHLIGVTLSQEGLRDQVKASGGGIKGMLAVCARFEDQLEELIRECSVDVSEWLSVDLLAQALRRALVPDESVAIADGSIHVTAATAGPMGVDVEWDRMRVDSAWHRVMEVAQWPTRPQQPGFMRFLNGADFPHVVTQAIRPQGVDAGMKRVQRRMSDQQSGAIMRSQLGQTASIVEGAVESDLERTSAELLAGHGMAKFVGLIVVSGGSADELERNTKRMIQGSTRAGCELRTLYGQQWAGFLAAALPLGRSMIKGK